MEYEKVLKLVLESKVKADVLIGLHLMKKFKYFDEFEKLLPCLTELELFNEPFWVRINKNKIIDFVPPEIKVYTDEANLNELETRYKHQEI